MRCVQAALGEGKRGRSPSRDPNPGLPHPTRVSKRQKARQEAAAAAEQEAVAAEQQPEEEEQEDFGGSATQVGLVRISRFTVLCHLTCLATKWTMLTA